MDKRADMTVVGFCVCIAGAGIAMIGIPYTIVFVAGEWPIVIPATLGALGGAFVIWYVVQVLNEAFDPNSAKTPGDDPPPDPPERTSNPRRGKTRSERKTGSSGK